MANSLLRELQRKAPHTSSGFGLHGGHSKSDAGWATSSPLMKGRLKRKHRFKAPSHGLINNLMKLPRFFPARRDSKNPELQEAIQARLRTIVTRDFFEGSLLTFWHTTCSEQNLSVAKMEVPKKGTLCSFARWNQKRKVHVISRSCNYIPLPGEE